jgi:hypothetical protein
MTGFANTTKPTPTRASTCFHRASFSNPNQPKPVQFDGGNSSPKACAVECVDSSGRTVWLADFDFDELCKVPDGWTFELTEMSPAVYSATGLGPRGETVCSTDTDPDKVLRDCRLFALRHSSL